MRLTRSIGVVFMIGVSACGNGGPPDPGAADAPAEPPEIDAPDRVAAVTAIDGNGDLGRFSLGDSVTASFHVRSAGDQNLGAIAVAVTGPFVIDASTCGQGAPCDVTVRTQVTAVGAATGTLTVSATPGGSAAVTLDAVATVTVDVEVIGRGRVLTSPGGIDCREGPAPSDCTEDFAEPIVRMIGIPDVGSPVTYSEPCTVLPGTSFCTLTLDGPLAPITVRFGP